MKPKINVIFPLITNPEIGEIQVEKMCVSRQRRKVWLTFGSKMPDATADLLVSELKRVYHLDSVNISFIAEGSENTAIPETADISVHSESAAHADLQAPLFHSERRHRTMHRVLANEMIYGRSIRDNLTPICEINEDSGRVVFRGEIFGVETKDIKSRKNDKEYHLILFDVTDYEDSISVQLFINKTDEDDVYKNVSAHIKKGAFVIVRGRAQYNDYAREVIISADSIAQTDDFRPVRSDNSPEKRVELHLHTQMSAMDGVTSAKELIDRAISWGHKAIAITDHGVVQSYPDGMKASSNNEKIKVLYGVEGYLVDDSAKIAYDCSGVSYDSTFVVFDLETTGLNKNSDGITEIGAVKIKNGEVIDNFSTFVNPQRPIPEKITHLTGISDEMVQNAPTTKEILPEFLEFCSGCVLVAQNAGFDTGFIKTACKKYGAEYNYSCLDTLILARCLNPELPNHKLDTLSKHYNVILKNHHRAVDDAAATADVFIKMLEELKEKGIDDLSSVNESFDLRNAAKKNRAHHIILLAKNHQGIRNIYEMVSESHLKYFFRTPRIPKSLLEEKREGLIIGSACEAGELFSALVGGADEDELIKIAEFYDYLEIQPIGNNSYMIRSDEHPNITCDEDLRNLNRKIVELGEKMNKPVVATCDVHFIDPEGANYRKILMHYKGFKDADQQAPLYFRTTEEMLEEFAYLGKEKAYEVVVTNTNLISDMIENVRPIPKEKCPPEIDGAEEGIVNDSHNKAKSIYGDPLPEIVQERLDKELYSITTYGFSVMYRIAQELVRKSLQDGYLVGSRGSVGSSFVAFLSDITEVNSLPPHYICPNCKNSEFILGKDISGCDLPDKKCPRCGADYNKDGHNIPFETFLGFKGDKEPDIDLNFSGEYQPVIHKYTETFFGEGHVFRAGTIGTVAEKTAYGYVRKYSEEKNIPIRNAEMKRLAAGCVGVKRTSGQHPGGIIVVPFKNDIHEFCPIQHPADDVNSNIVTTHFDYHSIDQNLLKLDELGHDDPTVIRMLTDLTGIDPQQIRLDDPDTLSLFTSTDALNLSCDIGTTVGTYGVPEFGTKFVRQMLVDTKPTTFSELVRISGLSHGTDVWLNNAQELIQQNITTLSNAICCRDDIMLYLINQGVDPGHSFKIMESVRKGKGLKPEDVDAMHEAGVPEWYLDSCRKIKYMFPKAHAVAYVTMAFRIAYCKVHYPEAFYIAYFSVRADDFDASIMANGMNIARQAMEDLIEKKKDNSISPKEENLIPILEICIEMYARGINFVRVDLYKSHATDFLQTPEGILPPLNALPGMGENAAKSITEEREKAPFKTREELRIRTGITKTAMEILENNHCLDGIPEKDQVTIFDLQ
ncbi:MAG: PolC-type DNA polymerase III [Clostridia bacterium]|nr:PolC-type DNA polymerase III [Clostridia bacterium]